MNKKLLELERTEKYLFHGSGFKIDKLEPRQAYNYPSASHKGRIPDGKPAVFASDKAGVAVFMSIFSSPNFSRGLRSGISESEDNLIFRVTKETFEQMRNARGYVYVFSKDKFQQRNNSHEWISFEHIKPLEMIEVTEDDLPDDIEIKNF